MLLMHGLSYGPALTRNTKERASVCQSDQVGIRPPRVTSHTILTRTIFSCMYFIPNCRGRFISSLTTHSAHWLPTRKKTLYTVANPARGLLNREKKKKKKSGSAPPPPRALLVRRKNKKNKKKCRKSRGALYVSMVLLSTLVLYS